MAPTKKASSSASSLSQLAVGEPEQQEPEQQSVSALSPREALGKGAKLIKNATEVLERLATLSPAWTMRTVAFVQLNVCFLLVLFCLFLGRKFYIVDSVVYYSLMMPLAIAVLLCVALPEKDVWRVRVMVTFIVVTMTTALLSSLYFMVKANEMEILRKECSRTVLMPLAQYSAADCARMINEGTGSLWRTGIFIVTQIVCIHPAVTYLIETHKARKSQEEKQQLQQSSGSNSNSNSVSNSN